MSLNTIKVPTLEQLRKVAAELGFTLDDAGLVAHRFVRREAPCEAASATARRRCGSA